MPSVTPYLLVGSTEAYSGKSATILGLAHQLKGRGVDIAYGKPLGTCLSTLLTGVDEDMQFVVESLALAANRFYPPIAFQDAPTLIQQMRANHPPAYVQQLRAHFTPQGEDLILLEGPSGISTEGRLLDLSLVQLALGLEAHVLLVTRCNSLRVVDALLYAHDRLGERLVGVILNDIPPELMTEVEQVLTPFLEAQGVAVLGTLPSNPLLRSVSVGELVRQLQAEVLCRPDRLGLMVEMLKIGAMNVNSALEYFRKGHNMAVVTGSDRADIQLAALETSTQCLILTGHLPPPVEVLHRAEEVETPILSVQLDTLTTVEIINRTFRQTRLNEQAKVRCIGEMMDQYFDCDRLLAKIKARGEAA